ncbi:hypothetical protein COCNU_scaffold001259G000010 [Cocos nucifera]|nr:hypothetical protein [Cocos nucifera]
MATEVVPALAPTRTKVVLASPAQTRPPKPAESVPHVGGSQKSASQVKKDNSPQIETATKEPNSSLAKAKATFGYWKVVHRVVQESLFSAKLEKMEELSFLNQQKEAFTSILRLSHYATIFINTTKAARSELAEAREKVEASQKAAEAKMKHLKEALEKAKTEANRASKKRKAVEAKVVETEKKAEGQIVEAGCLVVEALAWRPSNLRPNLSR